MGGPPVATRTQVLAGNDDRSVWRRWWPWLAIGVIAAVSGILGYRGFWLAYSRQGQTPSHLHMLYLMFQLFTLESGASVEGPVPWQLEVARFLAPVVPAWTLWKALATVFRDQLHALRLRFKKNHVVICGLGRKALQLAKDFREQGLSVVVVEYDADNNRIRACRELGAFVVIGDAGEQDLLRQVRVFTARYVVALCGDDPTNVAVASLTRQLVQECGDADWTVHCFIHVVDLRLCELLKKNRALESDGLPFEVHIFNIYENTARLLHQDFPLDRGAIGAQDELGVHLVAVGFGQMGQSVVLQAAKVAHFANERLPRVTVVDRHAKAKKDLFYGRYPQFDQTCDVAFVNEDVESLAMLDRLRQWACEKNIYTTIVICLDDDARAVVCALDVLERLGACDTPVLVRTAEDIGLAALINRMDGGADWQARVHSFGTISKSCNAKTLLREDLDRLARAIHQQYCEDVKAFEGEETSPNAAVTWDELTPEKRDSNRHQADHIPVKLRAIGCTSGPINDPRQAASFTDEEVELLARMEHTRWCKEQLLGGWSPGERNNQAKTHPYLRPWEDLPEEIKEYDRKAVRGIPRLLKLVDEAVYRVGDTLAADVL